MEAYTHGTHHTLLPHATFDVQPHRDVVGQAIGNACGHACYPSATGHRRLRLHLRVIMTMRTSACAR